MMHYYWQYLQYLIHSKHRKGFGVHSPFMFYFITKVIEEKLPFYRFVQLKNLRKILSSSTKLVADKPVSYWTKRQFSDAYQQMLFRFVHALKPRTIVEMGTSIGLSAAYLATPDSKASVISVEENGELARLAEMNLRKVGADNVRVKCMSRENVRDVWKGVDQCEFLYFSPSFPSENIEEVYEEGARCLSPGSVVVMADLYRSKERMEVWKALSSREEVRVSLELHHYGLLFFDEKLQKEKYNLFYIPPFFSK